MLQKTKRCSVCKIEKPYDEYFRDNCRALGIRCKCKLCEKAAIYKWREKNRSEYNNYAAHWRAKNPERQHASEIKRRYAMSPEDYAARLLEQNNRCKICETEHDPSKKRKRLYVDHCHTTKAVRGLLCATCNSGLGSFKNSTLLLRRAARYLLCDSMLNTAP